MSLQGSTLLRAGNWVTSMSRFLVVLKRKRQPLLEPEPKEDKADWRPRQLRRAHRIYDVIEHRESKKWGDIKLVLTTYIEGLGSRGDVVEVSKVFAHRYLLHGNLAVYLTPENVEKFKPSVSVQQMKLSPYILQTVKHLKNMDLPVPVNHEVAWTLDPSMVRVAFRCCGGVEVPQNAISLPEEPITFDPDVEMIGPISFEVEVNVRPVGPVVVPCHVTWAAAELPEDDTQTHVGVPEPIKVDETTNWDKIVVEAFNRRQAGTAKPRTTDDV